MHIVILSKSRIVYWTFVLKIYLKKSNTGRFPVWNFSWILP